MNEHANSLMMHRVPGCAAKSARDSAFYVRKNSLLE